jgi:lactate/malate dehydrogenase, NAD binding domain
MGSGTGASGGIGQPLSLLLKMNERVDVLSLYDVVGTPGVGADVGHIDSIAKVGLDRGVPWMAAEQPKVSAGQRGMLTSPNLCSTRPVGCFQLLILILQACLAGGGVRRRPAG